MIIKLNGFSENFAAEIKRKGLEQGLQVTNETNFDIEFIVDPYPKHISTKKNQILVLVEPEVVRPDLYRKKIWEKFYAVLPMSKYRANRLGLTSWFDLPTHTPEYKRRNNERSNKWAIINEHKFSASNRSQYGLRREVIRYFERERPFDLDLYGVEWNKDKTKEFRRRIHAFRLHGLNRNLRLQENFSDMWHTYPLVKGHMQENLENLQNYNYSIVIENDIDYVSEKVWKSLYAGAVPVYVGPNLEFDKELRNVVVFAEPVLDDIKSKMETVEESNLQEIRDRGYKFISNLKNTKYSLNSCSNQFVDSAKDLLGL